jgi:predicted enzyme related to lactoylglutathione lyase
MPAITNGTTPVQIKIGVTDLKRAREFYERALGISESVIRHTDEFDVSGFQFGTYGQPGFFLMFLLDSEAFDNRAAVPLGSW